MASDPCIRSRNARVRMLVPLVMVLALLLAPTLCTGAQPQTRAPIYRNYTDELGDVKDKGTGLPTSAKPMYDIANVSFVLGDDRVTVEMVLASGLDRDGFYIFQCEANGAKGYRFYFAQDAFGGMDPGGAAIPVSGNATVNSVQLTVSLALLGAASAFDIDNASAQDGGLKYIDVLDCASQRATAEAYNAITLCIRSERLLLLRQVTTYSDSRALKDGMDTDKNGYVDVPESQGCEWSLQSGLYRFISNNTQTYYESSIYVNGERPWDITVQVYVWIDEPAVSKADGSSITFDYYLTYKNIWGSSITLSLPPGSIADNAEQGKTTFKMELAEGYSMDPDATDEPLRQSVFKNGSGLSIDDAEFKALTAERYDVAVKTPLKDEEGHGYGIYVIITIISITIAFCIFVGYKMLTKRREDGAGGSDVRGGPKARGRGAADGKQDKGARQGKPDGGRQGQGKTRGGKGRRGQGQRPGKKGRKGGRR